MLEKINNSLQEVFENEGYLIASVGLLGEIAFFNCKIENNSFDIMISKEIIDFIPVKPKIYFFGIQEPHDIIKNYLLAHEKFIIKKESPFVEEYELIQINGAYFIIEVNSKIYQILIYPGDFAIPMLLGEEATIPEYARPHFVSNLTGDDIEFDVIDMDNVSNKKKTRKIGRNEPCPCGSGKKYKKCCGNPLKSNMLN